jgi:sigma-B regulation protein RsbQ
MVTDLVTDARRRNNVHELGAPDGRPMVLAHGYGCDQSMWRLITPAFVDRYRVILFDHVGAGGSDLSAYSSERYSSLDAYAEDLVEICRDLGLTDAVFVGHSVSAMIGVLAAKHSPDLFSDLVLVGPSPRYIDEEGYVGGFSRDDIDSLLESLDSNYLGWAASMAPAIMGNGDRPELSDELANSFCRTDPSIAREFAAVTFLSDNRADLTHVEQRSLVLQCSDDVIAPDAVGDFVHRRLHNSELVRMRATGHCPHLSAPEETIRCITTFLNR